MSWLLRLYPQAWRRRYGAEFVELVDSQPRTLRLLVDLLGGAIDAHLKPQAFARQMEPVGDADGGGSTMLTRIRGGFCATERMSRKEALFGGALTIGCALALAGMMLVWRTPKGMAVAMTMFPGVLVVGTQLHALRGRSVATRVVLIGGMFLVLFGIGMVAAFLM